MKRGISQHNSDADSGMESNATRNGITLPQFGTNEIKRYTQKTQSVTNNIAEPYDTTQSGIMVQNMPPAPAENMSKMFV